MPTEDLTQAPPANAVDEAVPRRLIEVSGGELHRWVDESWAALMEANDPQRPEVLLNGNDLVRLSDGKLVPFDVHSLRERLSRVASFVAPTENGPRPKTPPREIADALLSRSPSEFVDAPRVERITDVPLVTRSGDVLAEPGYYPEDRIYYLPAEGLDGLTVPGEGDVDNPQELEEARDFLLNDWLGEFGFADEASRANALAMLLTPFVREFVGGGVPLMPVEAAQYGWGKSLVTDACFIPSCGLPPKAPGTGNEEEMRKRITATLRGVPSAVVIDNVSGRLDSGALANVLTTGRWQDRILGESRNIDIEPRCVWSVNGNNFTLSGELVERCPAPIVLGPGARWDALCEAKGWDPALRPREQARGGYSHPEYRTWALAHRAEAVRAAFVLIRHWLDGPAQLTEGGWAYYRPNLHGGPEDRADRLCPRHAGGEFFEWQRTVGGVLLAADVEGFGSNYGAWAASTDDEGDEIAEFLGAWRKLGCGPLPFKEVEALTRFGCALHDHLPADLATVRADKLHGVLKAWLRDHKEQRHRGYTLHRIEGRPVLWEVVGEGDA